MTERHPRVEPQPVCTDRLTLSRERIQRLIDKADERPTFFDAKDLAYRRGIAEALDYLLNSDRATPQLARTLDIGGTR